MGAGGKAGGHKIAASNSFNFVEVDDLRAAVEKFGLRTERNKQLRGRLWEKATEEYNTGKAFSQLKTKTQLMDKYKYERKKQRRDNKQAGLDFLNME